MLEFVKANFRNNLVVTQLEVTIIERNELASGPADKQSNLMERPFQTICWTQIFYLKLLSLYKLRMRHHRELAIEVCYYQALVSYPILKSFKKGEASATLVTEQPAPC
ncbi:unnamed protein product [Gongylonema pulchrum]|uniref:Uncharacterized protein n=1 Tax=Gongylonema pulchrum TaxID=637853 RepID=A0A183EF44_9BILA|nr:unnamed protein product [Gongylonema pulchrum]